MSQPMQIHITYLVYVEILSMYFKIRLKFFCDVLKHWSEENDESCWLYSIKASNEVMCLIIVAVCHVLQWVRDSDCLPAERRCCPPAAASICNPFSTSSWHLCSRELQEQEAVLTWKRREEQQEWKCSQLPFGKGCYQETRAVHGMVRVGVIPPTSAAPAVAERKGWSPVDVPRAPAAPHQPLWWVGSAAAAALPRVALGCTGLCFQTPHKNFSKEVS